MYKGPVCTGKSFWSLAVFPFRFGQVKSRSLLAIALGVHVVHENELLLAFRHGHGDTFCGSNGSHNPRGTRPTHAGKHVQMWNDENEREGTRCGINFR